MRFRLLILPSLLLVLLGAGCSWNLRQSAERTEAALLALTPLGSSPEAVLELVKKKGWSSPGFNAHAGFLKQQSPQSAVIGRSHIRASLGNYQALPLGTTNVTAFWGFDENRRLIQIWIWKTTDSL